MTQPVLPITPVNRAIQQGTYQSIIHPGFTARDLREAQKVREIEWKESQGNVDDERMSSSTTPRHQQPQVNPIVFLLPQALDKPHQIAVHVKRLHPIPRKGSHKGPMSHLNQNLSKKSPGDPLVAIKHPVLIKERRNSNRQWTILIDKEVKTVHWR